MSSSVCIKPGKGGVVYICVRGFNVVSICSTRFWTVLSMVFCVFPFINVLPTFNLSARCALLDPETLMQQKDPITRINTLIIHLDFQWPCLSVGTLWSCLLPLKLWVSIPLMVYSTQHYIIKFVSNLRQVGGFRRILRLPPPIILTHTT
jgi:hypothetical protein